MVDLNYVTLWSYYILFIAIRNLTGYTSGIVLVLSSVQFFSILAQNATLRIKPLSECEGVDGFRC